LLLYDCVTPTNKSHSGKILHQLCTIYWQSERQILVESAKANNSYNGFYEVSPKHFSFKSLWMTSDLKLRCFGVTSQKPLLLLFALADLTEI